MEITVKLEACCKLCSRYWFAYVTDGDRTWRGHGASTPAKAVRIAMRKQHRQVKHERKNHAAKEVS